MSRRIIFIFIILILAHQVLSQYIGYGPCPNTSNSPAIDLRRYCAKPWYYIYSFQNAVESSNRCSVENLTVRPDGNVTKITTAIRNGQVRYIYGVAYINKAENGGVLDISLINKTPLAYSFTYNILKTDYSNFSVAYSCHSFLLGLNVQFSWILSRNRTLSKASAAKVKAVLAQYGIPTDRYYNPYQLQDQKNCPAIL